MIKTLLAISFFTGKTRLHTSGTEHIAAIIAAAGTVVANSFAATLATAGTVCTDGRIALPAEVIVSTIHQVIAIPAICPVPFIQTDIGGIGVVCFEDLSHEQKEIGQPSLLESRLDGRLALSFAKPFILNIKKAARLMN